MGWFFFLCRDKLDKNLNNKLISRGGGAVQVGVSCRVQKTISHTHTCAGGRTLIYKLKLRSTSNAHIYNIIFYFAVGVGVQSVGSGFELLLADIFFYIFFFFFTTLCFCCRVHTHALVTKWAFTRVPSTHTRTRARIIIL